MVSRQMQGHVEKLRSFFLPYETVEFAFLFGSSVRGSGEGGDLDIGAYFSDPPRGFHFLELVNDLSLLTGREVDLVVLNGASSMLRHQVMKHGVPILVRNEVLYREFREKTISDYDEYRYVSGFPAHD